MDVHRHQPLLLEAGLGTYLSNWNTRERYAEDQPLSQDVRARWSRSTSSAPRRSRSTRSAAAARARRTAASPDLNYRNQAFWNADWIGAHTWNAAATFVTGSNSHQDRLPGRLSRRQPRAGRRQRNDLTYRFNNGIPNQLTQRLEAYRTYSRVRYNALFVQDQLTRGRLTMSGALRYDHSWSYYPEQSIGGRACASCRRSSRGPRSKGVIGYNDITPRAGVAYDVFGNGKTAVKFNVGKYLEAAVNGNGNYSALLPSSRIDLDADAHLDRRQRQLHAGLRSAERRGAGPARGRRRLLRRLGQPELRQGGGRQRQPIYSLGYAEKILKGWGTRPSDWQIGVTLQQEILPRVSVEVGYTRRWLQNFTVTDNLAVVAADFDHVQRRRAARSAPAGRRRLHGERALQRQAGQVLGAAEQPAHLRAGLRRRSRRSTTASTST